MKLWELLSPSSKKQKYLVIKDTEGFARPLKKGWELEIIPMHDEGIITMYAYEDGKMVDGAEDYEISNLWALQRKGAVKIMEDGKIIPNVNTTCDVQPGETERQAAKFGNKLDAKSRPPLLRGSYGDDSARFSANQGDPFYGSDGTRLTGGRK